MVWDGKITRLWGHTAGDARDFGLWSIGGGINHNDLYRLPLANFNQEVHGLYMRTQQLYIYIYGMFDIWKNR